MDWVDPSKRNNSMNEANRVKYTFIQTTKFKTTTISVRFLQPLTLEKASLNALLSQSLVDRCIAFPTKQAMANSLDALYGASVSSSVNGIGHGQVVEIKFKFINPSFAFDVPAFEEGIYEFIKQILFYPLLSHEIFEEAKRVLISKIKRMEDDPQSYAGQKALKIAGKDTSLGISNYGEIEQVERIDWEMFKQGYQELIDTSVIDVLVVGNVQASFQTQLQKLPFEQRTCEVATWYEADLPSNSEVVELRNIPQSVIQLVYAGHTSIHSEHYLTMRIMNALLGVFPTSLLFQEVREKRSLCYSIYSMYIGFDSVVQISTGVEDANIAQTIALIQEQVERIQKGDFSEELLDVTKKMMINTFQGIHDDANSILQMTYQSKLVGKPLFDEHTIAAIHAITKEEVVEVANRLQHLVTYVLTKDETYGKTHE
ncbi:MAG: EF-P 5-aminopentanol modification-associated protein YfmF [Erysipelotrichaceae bacterium]